jgi:hypothetical protein
VSFASSIPQMQCIPVRALRPRRPHLAYGATTLCAKPEAREQLHAGDDASPVVSRNQGSRGEERKNTKGRRSGRHRTREGIEAGAANPAHLDLRRSSPMAQVKGRGPGAPPRLRSACAWSSVAGPTAPATLLKASQWGRGSAELEPQGPPCPGSTTGQRG